MKITGGLYLVIDPSMGTERLLPKVMDAINGGVDVLQIWNNWQGNENKLELVESVCKTAHDAGVPVLINEEYELLKETNLDGVHFDKPPLPLHQIRKEIGRPVWIGVTCGNDLESIQSWLNESPDYISFCSLYPSRSVSSCDLIDFDVVRETVQKCRIPVFVSGGITLNNAREAIGLGVDGLAVISAIMAEDDPQSAASEFKKIIRSEKNRKR